MCERGAPNLGLVVNDEDVIARSEDVVQPHVEIFTLRGGVVLSHRRCQPAVAQIEVHARVDHLRGEGTLRQGHVVPLVRRLE